MIAPETVICFNFMERMKATDKVLTLLEVVADMTESEWYQVSHAINQMCEKRNASIIPKVKLEDIEAMRRDFERFTP